MREEVLTYDQRQKRMDICFSLEKYHGGLHCGECFDILINDVWKPTRIEIGEDWYLVDINKDIEMQGLKARI